MDAPIPVLGQIWADLGTRRYLSLRVAEDDGLCDGERVVQVAECVKFPLLFLHRDKELLDPLERQLVALHQHLNGPRELVTTSDYNRQSASSQQHR